VVGLSRVPGYKSGALWDSRLASPSSAILKPSLLVPILSWRIRDPIRQLGRPPLVALGVVGSVIGDHGVVPDILIAVS
jgi:hypothetical protein